MANWGNNILIMKKILTLLIVLSALEASSQTTLTTAQLTARIIAADTAIARANRNITTLFAQNDSYKVQLVTAQNTIAKLVADTVSKSKRIADLEARQLVVGNGLLLNNDTLSIGTPYTQMPIILNNYETRISILEDWKIKFAAWLKTYML